MYDTTDIKNYILYLKHACGLFITLHPIGHENVILPSELMTFNIHDNSYCIYVKTFPTVQKHCIECQKKVFSRVQDGSFCGTCFAGVREYVYPISDGERVLGFVSVSGYADENGEQYLDRVAREYALPREMLSRAYGNLMPTMPKKTEIDTLLAPLCAMLELAYRKSADETASEEPLMARILRYVKKNHTQDITLDDVCRHVSYSRSYVSHHFKTYTGKSFREYLTELRLADAQTLLLHSRLNVTEIALSTGFGNSNYFSDVFRKAFGVSPIVYRRENG